MESFDTLGFLLGSWRVARIIDDRRERREVTFDGTATIAELPSSAASPSQRMARFEESGDVALDNYRGPSRRSLLYVQRAGEPTRIDFADGRPFADIDLADGYWATTHQCGLDLYQIAFTIIADEVLSERWQVSGPAKDYVAVTTLTREQNQTPGCPSVE